MDLKNILQADARLSDHLRVAERPGRLRNLAVFFAHSGDSWFWGAALLIVWWFSKAFWRQWAVVVLAGISVLAALVMGLKFIIRRRRPEGDWGGIYRNTDPHSFPSGHAARACFIAVLATGLGPDWAAFILWIWAPAVSLARVAMGVHYLSDIVAGVVVGILAGVFYLQAYQAPLSWLGHVIGVPLW